MRHRQATNPKEDRRIFHNTARKTKKVNISPKPMRGGIRF